MDKLKENLLLGILNKFNLDIFNENSAYFDFTISSIVIGIFTEKL
jgi:hypothetical protein